MVSGRSSGSVTELNVRGLLDPRRGLCNTCSVEVLRGANDCSFPSIIIDALPGPRACRGARARQVVRQVVCVPDSVGVDVVRRGNRPIRLPLSSIGGSGCGTTHYGAEDRGDAGGKRKEANSYSCVIRT